MTSIMLRCVIPFSFILLSCGVLVVRAAETVTVQVPGDVRWINSGVAMKVGQVVTIEAKGSIQVSRKSNGQQIESQFSPAGTYHFTDAEIGKPFALWIFYPPCWKW